MSQDFSACLWEELSGDTEFEVDSGGQPAVFCHHPVGTGFCDYREVDGENRVQECPYFKNAVPLHAVELEQHLEMLEPDSNLSKNKQP